MTRWRTCCRNSWSAAVELSSLWNSARLGRAAATTTTILNGIYFSGRLVRNSRLHGKVAFSGLPIRRQTECVEQPRSGEASI
jgi:hypothetical protein